MNRQLVKMQLDKRFWVHQVPNMTDYTIFCLISLQKGFTTKKEPANWMEVVIDTR